MNIINSLEKGVKFKIMETLIGYLEKNPERNVDKIFSVIRKLVKDETQLKQIDFVYNYYKENPTTHEYIQNILNTTDTKCLKKLVTNFFVNANWYADAKRRKYLIDEDTEIPFVMLISPSMRCPLHCVGCYAANYSKDADIPPVEVERLIKEARELGIYWIVVLGGEPFYNDYLLDIYEKYDDMMFSPFTSGILITDEVADRIKECGNVFPMLSIEGFKEDTEARRGVGTYEKVMHAMELLKERGILFGVSTCVTRTNIDDVLSDEFTDMLIEKGSKISWYFMFMPVSAHPQFDMMLTPEQRIRLGRRTNEIRTTKPYFAIDFFNDAPHIGGCIAGKYYFHINSKEDAEPCVFAHFSTVNLKGRPLIDAFRDPFFKELRHRQPYNKNMLRPCMMIDNTNVIKNVCKKVGAKPTDAAGETMLNDKDFHEKITKLANEFTPYADKEWKETFNEKGNDELAKG
ncbi:radical SAM protein [Clostridium estertheticum]|uniref:radical SAM protein n=1 Tax=Clostridium estertheticum TaxID=238834 RepID=UPI001CF2BA1E|nr:radical SAM protein [Clostridium estertheticum]MCB2307108.1 radical SAM protein [Clostridium estertheticum]MCB2344036.1 radical SAM protein [Clostridium estertheticum]MCB2348350.1 radical SAM protein [Clostridium estertheticum]WAG45979.1 radical SAM protein [Clostridium estertheticum]